MECCLKTQSATKFIPMEKKIAVLPGDGIGPEVVEQAVKVLAAIADKRGHSFEFCYAPFGAAAIDLTGNPLPEDTLQSCLDSDAVLLGAIGHPRFDNNPEAKVRPEQGLLGLRKALQLYANIRPVKTYQSLSHLSPLKENRLKKVDFIIYRELTGGIYFGEKSRSEDGNSAYDTCYYEKHEIERIAKLAFEQAMLREKKVTLVDKANVLETSRLWRKVVTKMAADFPEVILETMFVDNAAMQLIQNPGQFDIVLTSNMFGDILSDEASVIVGSIGLLPSESVGVHTSLFEPVHGSFPQAAGKDIANPGGTILSAALMLDSWGLHKEANVIRFAVQILLEKGIGTSELDPQIIQSCSEFGDLVASLVEIDNVMQIDEYKLNERISTII